MFAMQQHMRHMVMLNKQPSAETGCRCTYPHGIIPTRHCNYTISYLHGNIHKQYPKACSHCLGMLLMQTALIVSAASACAVGGLQPQLSLTHCLGAVQVDDDKPALQLQRKFG